MLTIKHVTDDGYEKIVSVVTVHFDPEEHMLTGCGPNEVEYSRHVGGHAWVMNEYGRTVGSYNLRPSLQEKKIEEAAAVAVLAKE